MKLSLLISHAIALVAGWMLISLTNSKTPETLNVSKPNHRSNFQRSNRPSYHSSGGRTQSPYALQLAALANTSLEPEIRRELKDEIYDDWAKSSPASLLEYLEHRAWPSSTFNTPFQELARSRPDILTIYGKQQGCITVFRTLDRESLDSGSNDPRITLEHYLTKNPATLTTKHFKRLFDDGSRLDPDFHLNISRIQDPAAREAAFQGATKALIELKRFKTYFDFFIREHESLPLESITNFFASQILSQGEDLTLINQLSPKARPLALSYTVENLSQLNRSETYHRDTLDLFISKGWLDDHIADAEQGIRDISSHDPMDNAHIEEAEAWKNWAFALPEDEKWSSLKETAIRRWILSAPSQWEKIAQLPSQKLRDIAYTAVISDVDYYKGSAEWVIGKIVDPLYREAAEKILRINAEAGEDPFGDRIDPFDPFKE